MRIPGHTIKTLGFLLLAAIVLAQDKPQREDPGGWNAAKWGMTVVEILAAFEGKAIRKDLVFASEVEGKLI
jgi:hypothetical protein